MRPGNGGESTLPTIRARDPVQFASRKPRPATTYSKGPVRMRWSFAKDSCGTPVQDYTLKGPKR
jgi:hypothetical protein